MARRNSESSESVESSGARVLAARANVMSIDWFVNGPRVLSVPYILDSRSSRIWLASMKQRSLFREEKLLLSSVLDLLFRFHNAGH